MSRVSIAAQFSTTNGNLQTAWVHDGTPTILTGKRNGQYRQGERTKAAIAERQKFSALLKMLRAGLT
jgi:hypothetical protein